MSNIMETILQQPDRGAVKAAREHAGLTQQQAAALVHLRAVQRWAEYESGARNMDVARWELFLIKTEQHPDRALKKAAKPRVASRRATA